MTLDKDDLGFIIIVLCYLGWNSYRNYTFTNEINEKVDRIDSYEVSILKEQVELSDRMYEIEQHQDSIRSYICKQKNK